MRRAFSLIELLVAIVIVAILISIAVPALARGRNQAKEVLALRSLGQLGLAVSGYAMDNNEYLPFLATPRKPWQEIHFGEHSTYQNSYFLQSRLVMSLLVPSYYSGSDAIIWKDCDYCPDLAASGGIYSSYWMTDTAFAAPQYWADARAPDDLSLYRGMRFTDVVFPSLKGLLLDRETSLKPVERQGGLSPYFVGRCDGGSSVKPFDLEEYEAIPNRPYMATPWPVMFTWEGFAGRDL